MSVSHASSFEFADLPGRRSADPLAGFHASSSVRVVELEHTDDRTAHRHPHTEEIVYVEEGAGEVWINGELHPVNAGDVVIVPVGAAHATIPSPGEKMRLICFFPHPDLGHNIEDTGIKVTEKGNT